MVRGMNLYGMAENALVAINFSSGFKQSNDIK